LERRQANGADQQSAMLSKHHFFKQLELEKRRTDRSKAPLSILVFELEQHAQGQAERFQSLANLLRASKRATDVLGYLGGHTVCLLLPDTNAQGAKAVATSVVARGGDLQFSIEAGTYPDQLFENLLAEHRQIPDSHPLLLHGEAEGSAVASILKRAVDIAGALAALVLLSPLMLIIATAIAATSPGPVIFKQVRLGRKGAPFLFYKFRSMKIDSDDRIHREYVAKLIDGSHDQINQGDSTDPLYKIKADPRVTRVGGIIRATSIDELPQLFNVLKGDMSLVGPRPPLPYEAEKYQSWHLRRILEIRPGITGLWQVEGRSKVSFDDMVRLDLQYIRTWSPLLDVRILLKTVLVVLRRDGAT
jgi:lipopolysaccharide/colanic/teichoic acid biosynthesis glycosyltransferase